jgi:hypothetical protein
VRLLLEFGGEFFDADNVFGLTGGMAASTTARLCPRASWQGCFLAAVRGLGQGHLRGVRLRRRRSWCLVSTWQVDGGKGWSGPVLQVDGDGDLGVAVWWHG